MGESLRFPRYMRAARAWPGIDATDHSAFCRRPAGREKGTILEMCTTFSFYRRRTRLYVSTSLPTHTVSASGDGCRSGKPEPPRRFERHNQFLPGEIPAPGSSHNPEAADGWAAPEAGDDVCWASRLLVSQPCVPGWWASLAVHGTRRAAAPVGPGEPVGRLADGPDDERDEQAADLVAGQRDRKRLSGRPQDQACLHRHGPYCFANVGARAASSSTASATYQWTVVVRVLPGPPQRLATPTDPQHRHENLLDHQPHPSPRRLTRIAATASPLPQPAAAFGIGCSRDGDLRGVLSHFGHDQVHPYFMVDMNRISCTHSFSSDGTCRPFRYDSDAGPSR
jgi:hypothetical protein